MRTLHRYLTRQVLATLLMTVGVFTSVLLLGNVLKEILILLMNRQASLGLVFRAFALLIPWVLAFALPMGMLTAALLVFGRFSADQELTAVRSSGVSLLSLITPILLLSLFLCGLSALVNMEVAPRCRVAYKEIIEQMKVKLAGVVLPEGRFFRDRNYIIYVGKNDGGKLKDIYIYKLDDEQKVTENSFAPRGQLVGTNQNVLLHLEEVQGTTILNGMWQPASLGTVDYELTAREVEQANKKPGLGDMTFLQLQTELRSIERMFSLPNSRLAGREVLRKRMQQLAEQKRDITMPIKVQMHRQIAFSFACFGFTLVGIPLGIRAHRRETNVGIAMALLLVVIYYCFTLLGQSLQLHPELAPHLIVWAPNFLFQTVGAVMLWRANRGI